MASSGSFGSVKVDRAAGRDVGNAEVSQRAVGLCRRRGCDAGRALLPAHASSRAPGRKARGTVGPRRIYKRSTRRFGRIFCSIRCTRSVNSGARAEATTRTPCSTTSEVCFTKFNARRRASRSRCPRSSSSSANTSRSRRCGFAIVCVPPSARRTVRSSVSCPPLILQPIVENAVRHGISAVSTSGTLEVTAEMLARHVRLTVRDDGPGMNAVTSQPGSGTGLRNTRERLVATLRHRRRARASATGRRGGTIVTHRHSSRATAIATEGE